MAVPRPRRAASGLISLVICAVALLRLDYVFLPPIGQRQLAAVVTTTSLLQSLVALPALAEEAAKPVAAGGFGKFKSEEQFQTFLVGIFLALAFFFTAIIGMPTLFAFLWGNREKFGAEIDPEDNEDINERFKWEQLAMQKEREAQLRIRQGLKGVAVAEKPAEPSSGDGGYE